MSWGDRHTKFVISGRVRKKASSVYPFTHTPRAIGSGSKMQGDTIGPDPRHPLRARATHKLNDAASRCNPLFRCLCIFQPLESFI